MDYIHWLRSKIGSRKTVVTYGAIVLRDAQRHILLQHRLDTRVWGLPGGVLEPGETIMDCARRETLEETGLLAGELRLVGVYADPMYDSCYPNGDQVQQYTVCFEAYVTGGEMRPDGVENSHQAFFSPESIPFADLPNFYQHMLRDSLAGGEPVFQPPFTQPEPLDVIQDIRPIIGNALYIGSGAMGVAVNPAGQILMVKRRDDGEWQIPGGYMHLGENPAYTAMREVQEETGITIAVDRILGIYSPAEAWNYPNHDQTQAVVTVFLAHPTGGVARPDQIETSQVAWLEAPAILALETHPGLQRLNRAVAGCLKAGTFLIG